MNIEHDLVQITTWSGSVYLLDFHRVRAKRIGDTPQPTHRFPRNHEWTYLADMGVPWYGEPYEFIWGYRLIGPPDSSRTSAVQNIEIVPLAGYERDLPPGPAPRWHPATHTP